MKTKHALYLPLLALVLMHAGCVSLSQISESAQGDIPVTGTPPGPPCPKLTAATPFVRASLPIRQETRQKNGQPERDPITPELLSEAFAALGDGERIGLFGSTAFNSDTLTAIAAAVQKTDDLFHMRTQYTLEAAMIYASGEAAPELRQQSSAWPAGKPLQLDRGDASAWADQLYQATASHGFRYAPIYYRYKAAALRNEAQRAADTKQRAQYETLSAEYDRLALTSTLMHHYFKAYFRNGKFFAAKLDVSDARKKIEESVKKEWANIDPAVLKRMTDSLLGAILGGLDAPTGSVYNLFGDVSDAAFVSRSGISYRFPAVSLTLKPMGSKTVEITELDYSAVGSDLVRVFVEAVGDGMFRLPADPAATGVTVNFPIGSKETALRAIDPNVNPDEARIAGKVNEAANTADGLAGAATGRIIRGISWFSLNNEALAKLVETFFAVIVRKGTERIAWAHYCGKEGIDPDIFELTLTIAEPRTLKLNLAPPRNKAGP